MTASGMSCRERWASSSGKLRSFRLTACRGKARKAGGRTRLATAHEVTLSLAARFTVMPRRGWLVLSALLFTSGCGTTRVPATTATNVIPWIAATPPIPTPTPAPAVPAGTPPCTSQNLQVVYQGGQGLGGGQLVATIGFTNVSGTDCFLQGVPGLSLIDAQGHLIITVPSGYRITDRTDPALLIARGSARQAYVPLAWPA